MKKFTKGEWLVAESSEGNGFVYAINSDKVNQFTALIQGNGSKGADDEEIKANANLIACAPDMYNLLNSIAISMECEHGVNTNEINKLLSKARGEL